VLSERIPRSSAAGLASELKIKYYSTLKIPRSLVPYLCIEGYCGELQLSATTRKNVF